MTLRRSLRLLAGGALPFALGSLALSGCIPGLGGGSAAATPTPAIRSTVPVHIGPVQLETHAAMVVPRPRKTSVPPAPQRRAVAVVTPHAAPSATPSFVFAAPHAPPKILAIDLSTLAVTGGDTVSGSVETTSNVASVEARIAGWSMSLPRTRIGHFEASGQLPDLPFFAKGTYKLEVIARNADGVKAERDIPITLR